MTYNLRTGGCMANKSEVHIHEGESFCKKLHPGAHLIGIMSEEERLANMRVLCNSFDLIVPPFILHNNKQLHLFKTLY